LMKLVVSLMANGTGCDYLVHVSSHLKPIEILFEGTNDLI